MDTGLLRSIISKHFDTICLRQKLPLIDYRDENVFQNLYLFLLKTIEEDEFPLLSCRCKGAKDDLEKYYQKQCADYRLSCYSELHAHANEKTKLIEEKRKQEIENNKNEEMITELDKEIVRLKEKVMIYEEKNVNLNHKLNTKNTIDRERARIILRDDLEKLQDKTEQLEKEKFILMKQLEKLKRTCSTSSLEMIPSLVSNESSSTMDIGNDNLSFVRDRSSSFSSNQNYDIRKMHVEDEEDMERRHAGFLKGVQERNEMREKEKQDREKERKDQIRKKNKEEFQPLLFKPNVDSHKHDDEYQKMMDKSCSKNA